MAARCQAIVGVSARQVWHGRGVQSGLPSPSAWKLEVARSGQRCSAGVSARQVTGVSARCLAIVGASARHVWHGRGMLSGLPSPSAQKVEVARVGQNCCAGVSARQVSGSRVSHQRHCRASAFSEEDTRRGSLAPWAVPGIPSARPRMGGRLSGVSHLLQDTW